jgi:hypothetical protein
MSVEPNWLFREGDLVLGPVPTKTLVDKLYDGSVGATTEVQHLGSGQFKKMIDVPEFKVHVARAQAKQRVDAHAAEHHTAQKKRLGTIVAVTAGSLLLLGVIVAVVGRYLAVHTPTTKSAEEIAWGDITIDMPTITRATKGGDEEMLEYRRPTGTTPGTQVAARDPKEPGKDPARPPEHKNPTGTTPKPKMGQADSDGLQMGEVDQSSINEVIARNRPKLIPCLKAVAKPGMVEKIPIEFSITEAGRVTKVWVENSTFKEGPLPECLLKELSTWQFKPNASGGATVQLSFNIGKRG